MAVNNVFTNSASRDDYNRFNPGPMRNPYAQQMGQGGAATSAASYFSNNPGSAVPMATATSMYQNAPTANNIYGERDRANDKIGSPFASWDDQWKQTWGSLSGGNARRNQQQAAEREAQRLETQMNDLFGQRPNYLSQVDPETGQLKDMYTMKPDQLDMTDDGQYMQYLNAANDVGPGVNYGIGQAALAGLGITAATPGLTRYGSAQTDAQRLEQDNLLNDVSRGVQQQTAQGYENLAATQGLDSGAAERMFSRGNQSGLQQMQEANRMGALQRAGIVSQDEGRKLDILKSLPGLNLGYDEYATGLDKYNNQLNLNKADRYGSRERFNTDVLNQAQNANINRSIQGAGNLYDTGYQQWKDLGEMQGNLAQSQQQIRNAGNAPSTWDNLTQMFGGGGGMLAPFSGLSGGSGGGLSIGGKKYF